MIISESQTALHLTLLPRSATFISFDVRTSIRRSTYGAPAQVEFDFEIALIQVKVFVAINHYRPNMIIVTTEQTERGSGSLRLLGAGKSRALSWWPLAPPSPTKWEPLVHEGGTPLKVPRQARPSRSGTF